MAKYYSEYFSVPQDYNANMTREAINKTPSTWLDFYPHKKYIAFLNTLLEGLKNGSKSVWLTGNFGTGKSNAALVTQKLFMDDQSRVDLWLNTHRKVISNLEVLRRELYTCREEGTLIVYDYNASGVSPHEEFLVRLEKGIISALDEQKMIVPAAGNLDVIIERLKREGPNFFATRDSIQSELAYLTPEYTDIQQIIDALNQEQSSSNPPTRLLDDVQKVFHKDNIYLNIDVTTFREWIIAILNRNSLKRVVYIFDEFSEFIDANKDQLKTFEDVTENPGINKFFLIPVTHLEINAFWSENSAGARKATDRFNFRNLQMPNDTAFRLAAFAMKDDPDPVIAAEWKEEREQLWNSVSSVADKFSPDDVSRQSFFEILPLHPMAAFLLKFLAESARSNQRSIFEYLKGSADGKEFQEFIHTGGPTVPTKQYLTADYLWKYFMERDDLGQNKEIISIRQEFERIKSREFQNKLDDDEDIRVLKAVLLFCLLARLNPDGHERLRPTIQNLELTFQGDGSIVDVRGIITNLANKHCFSVVNDNIELYTSSVGGQDLQDKIEELKNKFHDLLADKVRKVLEDHTKKARTGSAGRFDIRVSDVGHTTLTNITSTTRDKYSEGQNKDDASICLWFVVAKNKEEQLLIPDKIKSILTQLRDHRILMFTFPKLTFCDKNVNLWNDYISQYAQYLLENNTEAKTQIQQTLNNIEREWFEEIKGINQEIVVYAVKNHQVTSENISWGTLKNLVTSYLQEKLPYCVDLLTSQITAFGNTGIKSWAKAGIQFEAADRQYKQLVTALRSQGISSDDSWFEQNSEHPLVAIRNLFKKKIANTIDKGTSLSIRKVYIELQRAPFGLKYNCLSGFVLGFALSYILDKNYQWTNEQLTRPLDVDTLAEIIESVVKDDGQDKIKSEKLICRLSKEEKTFVEKAPLMFGIKSQMDTTVEGALLQIQNKIESISKKVPLWVLPEYIYAEGDTKADDISMMLQKICTAGSISSRGNTEERSIAVKEIGAYIGSNGDIVGAVSKYIKAENFVIAFQLYVDKNNPKLKQLANELGDLSHDYCNAILDKTATTAGLLWTPTDISKEIEETYTEYEVIKLTSDLIATAGFVNYKSISKLLRKAIVEDNRIPKVIIETSFPILCDFFTAIQNNSSPYEIKKSLLLNKGLIKALFYDLSYRTSIDLIKTRIPNIKISNQSLIEILKELEAGFDSAESTFLNELQNKIEDCIKKSVAENIKNEWTRISGQATPNTWSSLVHIPARYAFWEMQEANELVSAIENHENFSQVKLAELQEIFHNLKEIDIEKCKADFLKDTIPTRYSKFKINFTSLVEFLSKQYGNQPNNWPSKPDLSTFIKSHYAIEFAPQIVEKIRKKDPEELKKRLLELAKEDQDLGLLFWE